MRKNNLDDITKQLIFKIAHNHNSVIILDASYHMHRFAYAHKQLSINNQGVNIPTGHIYGFLKMVVYLKRKFGNPAIVICVDGYDKERKLENSGYKANRAEKEFSIHGYTNDVIKMASLISGVYVSYNNEYEADDTIYNVSRTLDTLFKKNGIDRTVYVYSSDKDLYQCVNDKIVVVKKFGSGSKWLSDAELVNVDGVREVFDGVSPDDLAKFRAICGDSSDNIKGYFRFPKAKASILAQECSITDDGLVPVDPNFVERYPKIDVHLNIINSDFEKFKSNYRIMKLKEYDFTLRVPETANGKELVKFYQMNSFRKELEILEGIGLDD
jgi:5'-3' exonuclease